MLSRDTAHSICLHREAPGLSEKVIETALNDGGAGQRNVAQAAAPGHRPVFK